MATPLDLARAALAALPDAEQEAAALRWLSEARRKTATGPTPVVETVSARKTVLRADLPIVVSNSPSKTQNAEVTIDADGKVKFWVEPGGALDHGSLTGLSDDDHTIYSLASGARQFAVAPNCAAADVNVNDLIRNTEVNAVVISLLTLIAARLESSAVSAFGLTLIDDADAAAARTTIGLGSLATQSVRSLDVALATIYITGMAWTAMPSAHTLAFGASALGTIRRVDLTQYTQCRLRVIQQAAAASGAKLRLRYATSFGTAASSYSEIGSGATEVDVSLSTSTAQSLASSWVDLTSSAKGDVWIACTGVSGNGSTSPSFWSIAAEFR